MPTTSGTEKSGMKLAIVAATGGIDRHLLEQAVAAGHDIMAVVGNLKKLSRYAPSRAIWRPRTRRRR